MLEIGLGALIIVVSTTAVGAVPLNSATPDATPVVKVGQWTMRRTDTYYPVDIHGVPKSSRGAFLQAIAQEGGAKTQTRTWSACLTGEDIAREFSAAVPPGCEGGVIAVSASTRESRFSCKPAGELPEREVTTLMTALDDGERVDIRTELAAGKGANARFYVTEVEARWQSGTCDGATRHQ